MRSDLGLKTLVKRKAPLLTTAQQQQRLVRAKLILSKLKGDRQDEVLIFSDEKDYHVDKYVIRRNSRYLAESPETAGSTVKYVGCQKFHGKAMTRG